MAEDSSDFDSDASLPDQQEDHYGALGRKFIQVTDANEAEDLERSLENYSTLTQTAKSLGGQKTYATWKNVLKHWRVSKGSDLSKPPTRKDLERFLDIIIRRLEPRGRGKLVPSLSSIQDIMATLSTILSFDFPGLKPKPFSDVRIQSLLNRAVKQGRLVRGKWYQHNWVGIHLVNRMMLKYLTSALEDGACNLDVILMKMMPTLLMVAVDARIGDVSQCTDWGDHPVFMQFRDVQLFLNDEGDTVEDLKANVVIRFGKGQKDRTGTERRRMVAPFRDSAFNGSDFILIIVAYALRLELFACEAGSDLESVLRDAKANHLGNVRWRHPDWPVLCHIDGWRDQLQTERPMQSNYAAKYLKEIALNAGIVSRITTHHIRYGGIQGLLGLGEGNIPSLTAAAAENVGHSRGTLHSGLTTRYSGGHEVALAGLKIKVPEPKVSRDIREGPGYQTRVLEQVTVTEFIHRWEVTQDEIKAGRFHTTEEATYNLVFRQRARREIRHRDQERFEKNQAAEPVTCSRQASTKRIFESLSVIAASAVETDPKRLRPIPTSNPPPSSEHGLISRRTRSSVLEPAKPMPSVNVLSRDSTPDGRINVADGADDDLTEQFPEDESTLVEQIDIADVDSLEDLEVDADEFARLVWALEPVDEDEEQQLQQSDDSLGLAIDQLGAGIAEDFEAQSSSDPSKGDLLPYNVAQLIGSATAFIHLLSTYNVREESSLDV